MLSFPITLQARNREWDLISKMAINNGFPLRLIHKILNTVWNTITQPRTSPETPPEATRKIWVPFTYHSPLIHKVTNLFRNTPLHIVFKPNNIIYQQLSRKPGKATLHDSGIYSLRYATCDKTYVGQSGRPTAVRYREHTRYIRTDNPMSAYALHILP
jgi:hypothetical protein